MESGTKQTSSFKLIKSTIWCLLVVAMLQLIALSNGQSSASESGSVLIVNCGECKPNEVCINKDDGTNVCEKQDCNFNCTNTEKKVCGSNGITYINKCELEMARCKQNRDIRVEYADECITLPPPPEPLCKTHQERYDSTPWEVIYEKCGNISSISNPQLADIQDCYRPSCRNNKYMATQCINLGIGRLLCWCSLPNGLGINETLQFNMPQGTCENRVKCEHENQVYQDGDMFSPANGCGLCQCLNGTVDCYEDYVPQPNGTLTDDQLMLLKEEVMKVFLIQYNHNEHVQLDIRFIHQYPTQVTDSLKSKILNWKFNYYDRNKDGILTAPEEFLFQMNLFDFVKCKSFFDHVREVIDVNNDRKISRTEWTVFFAEELRDYTSTSGSTSVEGSSLSSVQALGKRSVSGGLMSLGRKPLNLRKKFFYRFY